VHETRGWATSYRGPLVVQAAKRKIDDFGDDRLHEICVAEFGSGYRRSLPLGALVGTVLVMGCIRTEAMTLGHGATDDYECGDYGSGRFAWARSDYTTFSSPLQFRGAQGFFDVPDEILAPLNCVRTAHRTNDDLFRPTTTTDDVTEGRQG
jgi:hypothetical protein